jgi:hypothetical protein
VPLKYTRPRGRQPGGHPPGKPPMPGPAGAPLPLGTGIPAAGVGRQRAVPGRRADPESGGATAGSRGTARSSRRPGSGSRAAPPASAGA